jgi:hypothetical protein
VKAHAPYEEDHRREEHDVEDEVFVHSPSIKQFGVV